MSSGQQSIKWRRNIPENFNRLSVHERYRRQTTDRQTDARRQIANMNMNSRSLIENRPNAAAAIAPTLIRHWLWPWKFLKVLFKVSQGWLITQFPTCVTLYNVHYTQVWCFVLCSREQTHDIAMHFHSYNHIIYHSFISYRQVTTDFTKPTVRREDDLHY